MYYLNLSENGNGLLAKWSVHTNLTTQDRISNSDNKTQLLWNQSANLQSTAVYVQK